MNKRIGAGNYDFKRTKFNVHYKNINKNNLYQEVKYNLILVLKKHFYRLSYKM